MVNRTPLGVQCADYPLEEVPLLRSGNLRGSDCYKHSTTTWLLGHPSERRAGPQCESEVSNENPCDLFDARDGSRSFDRAEIEYTNAEHKPAGHRADAGAKPGSRCAHR